MVIIIFQDHDQVLQDHAHVLQDLYGGSLGSGLWFSGTLINGASGLEHKTSQNTKHLSGQ